MKRIFALVFLLIFELATAQKNQVHWDMINSGQYSLKEIQIAANAYFKGKDTGKGSGYKQYKRWEYFAARTVDENGFLETEIKVEKEVAAFRKRELTKQYAPAVSGNSSGNWEELGVFESNPTSSWNPGVGRVECISVDPNDSQHILLGLPSGGAWSTKVGGNDWKNLTDNKTVLDIRGVAIAPTNSNIYYLGTTSGLYRSTDQGANWNHIITSGTIIKILPHPTDANIVLIAGSGGIKRSTDGGLNFTTESTGSYKDMVYKPGDANYVYACDGSGIYRSTDNGQIWNSISTAGSGTGRIAVTPANPSVVYYTKASGSAFGYLFKSTNSGASFSTVGSHSVDYYEGYSWYGIDLAVSDTDEDLLYMGGMELYRSTNGGNSFTLHAAWSYGSNKIKYIHADIHCLEWVNGHLYTGTDGAISIDDQNGDIFHDLSTSLGARQFYKIGVSKSDVNTVVGGAQDNGTAVMTGTDHTWYEWLGADGMEAFVDWSDPNNLYGTSQNGVLYKSTNKGQSYSGFSGPGGSGKWVTPFEQDPINSNTVYVGIGGVQKKVGSGSWQLISYFTSNLDEIKIAQTNNQIIYASTGSTLYRTINGGGSWNTVSGLNGSINYIAIHPEDPNYVAVATSSGSKVYVSTDGGVSFSGYLKNLPSIAAQCVVWQDGSDHGLYVGLSDGIYYIDDNESDWLAFMDNMPNVKISELEINYAAQKIYAGTYGRGLWISDCYGAVLADNDIELISLNNLTEEEFCASSINLTPEIDIKNRGTLDLTSFTVNVDLDGSQIATYTYTGTLISRQAEVITLAALNNIGGGNHILTFTAVNPNGSVDEDPSNNSLTYNFNVVDGSEFELAFTTDDYSTELSWELKNSVNTVLYSEDYNTDPIGNNTTVNYDLCLADECFDFIIPDSYGDGMTGGSNGNYVITDVNDGSIKVDMDNAAFGDSKTHNFCAVNVAYDIDVAVISVLNVPSDLCGSSVTPTVIIKNLGALVLTTVDLKVYVDDVLKETINHSTSLTKGQSEEIDIASLILTTGAKVIKIVVENPNGSVDENLINNESEVAIDVVDGTSHEFYVTDRSANLGLTWEIKDGSTSVITSLGLTSTTVGSDKVQEFCLENGCFDIVVTDAFQSGGCNDEAWGVTTVYLGTAGGSTDIVSYNGKRYQAGWWTQGNVPSEGGPWAELGDCMATFDTDYYGLRKNGEAEYFTVEVQNYASPSTNSFCSGNVTTTVDFTLSATSATNCETVSFNSTASPIGTNYTWDFGTGASPEVATGAGPHQVMYLTTGQKSIALTVDGVTETKSNALTILENTALNPTASIQETSSASCEGDQISFSSSVTNEGSSPAYIWKVNGAQQGTDANFTSTTLKDGDQVSLQLTSSDECAVSNVISSNTITLDLSIPVIPSISISATANSICEGESVEFISVIQNGGTSPVVDWSVGTGKVSTASSYSSINLQNGDVVSAKLISDLSCVTSSEVISGIEEISVTDQMNPSITIISDKEMICQGDEVSFTSVIQNGGTSPVITWFVGNNEVATGESTFSSSDLVGGAVVNATLGSNATCADQLIVSSNVVALTVDICTGTNDDINIAHLDVYPNPVTEELHIKGPYIESVELINELGVSVGHYEVNRTETILDMNAYSPGVYIVKITSEGKQQSFSVVKP